MSLVAAGMVQGASAAPTAPGPEEAVAQFQVSAVDGDTDALGQRLIADGYDVYGGSAGVLFVHAPVSAADDLAARADLDVVAENVLTLDPADAEPVSQDAILPARLDGRGYPTFYGGYRTVAGYNRFVDDLESAYPELVKVIKYGETYEEEQDLRVVCVTADAGQGCKVRPAVDKARFLFVAQIHARELTTSEMVWRTLALLTDKYGRDADITSLLDETEIWLVPQINPDGIEQVQRGFGEGGGTGDIWQRKNMHQEQACGTGQSTQVGTDLNRNFDSAWGTVGSSPAPCNLTYRGQEAASEPETFMLQDLMKDIFEDQRGSDPDDPAPNRTRGSMLTLHSYSNLVLFPYGDSRHTPNDAGLRSMGFRMSHYNGYETGEPDEILYQVSGSTDDYLYEKLGIAAFTFEIGPGGGSCSGFHPAYTCQDMFWDLNRDAFLYAARAAQQPYVMGMGPTVLEAKSKNKGKKAKITATADDDAYGSVGVGRPSSQNVTAGRVFVGKAPWDGGKAKAMQVKGSGKEVDLAISLKRESKKKLVWVQAKDAAGNWGPTRAVWLDKR